jgi:hypothetical protein
MARRSSSLLATFFVAAVTCAGCGGKDATAPTAPSTVPSVIQGSVGLSPLQFAVVSFRVDRAGTLSSQVDWATANNDIDTALVRGRCTADQILTEAPGCNEAAAIVTDESLAKPSVFSPSVEGGDHTLIILNWGPGVDTATYRLQGNVSGGTVPSTSPVAPTPAPTPAPSPAPGPRRTDTFGFTLPAGSQASVTVGSVRAANGPLEVRLDFSGNYIILACVGTASSCLPMGGRPQTRTFSIPGDFPAGTIQAKVYFNTNFPQPSGAASGTVTFIYTP